MLSTALEKPLTISGLSRIGNKTENFTFFKSIYNNYLLCVIKFFILFKNFTFMKAINLLINFRRKISLSSESEFSSEEYNDDIKKIIVSFNALIYQLNARVKEINFPGGGIVEELLVKEGDFVKKNQLLILLMA